MTGSLDNEWSALVALPDEQLPLARGAWLIAVDEYPSLDPQALELTLQNLARRAARRGRRSDTQDQHLQTLSRFLFDECGFRGNQENYYDPRNSYLNDVLDRRLGIPISLAMVQLEVARRLKLPLEGVSFPGHFLVRLPVEEGLLVVDPYQFGRSLDVDELKRRAGSQLNAAEVDDQMLTQFLQPASNRSILMRMLRNLKALYSERGDLERALRCSDRLLRLAPSAAEEWRDRGLMYLQAGYTAGARSDLARYLQLMPNAADAPAIHAAQSEAEARGGIQRLN